MDPFALIIFGITGNLAQIKLIPALYDMEAEGVLPEGAEIIGVARKPQTQEEFSDYIRKTLNSENRHHPHPIKPEVVESLIKKMQHCEGNLDDPLFYARLKEHISKDNRIFYLATYPDLYHTTFENLKKSGLSSHDKGWVRLMIEKPIGNDLESAKKLNQLLDEYFTEDQIFRLDHYLGKETLQNILAVRFGNDVFEPLINKEHIDHIQITATEDFGIGQRGGYFDKVGMLKDTGQNHQLQMLAFATMEKPVDFSSQAIRESRLKLLQSIKPLTDKVVFGQYEGYKQEANVDPNSNIDTFYALKCLIDNDRFRDVPIYIRAGKKLKETVTEVAIVFKGGHNTLIYRIQPNEGIVLKIVTKKPRVGVSGPEIKFEDQYLQYCYRSDPEGHALPDPYERLLLDAIRGDQTFFNSAAEIEAQWAFIDEIANYNLTPTTYNLGSWGPDTANELLEADGKKWLEPSMDFCRI
jgi:glucose-6-phosphate 1-dehydrogenase